MPEFLRFIKLTGRIEGEVYIRADQIDLVDTNNGRASVLLRSGRQVAVTETPLQVIELIVEAKRVRAPEA